MTFESKEGGSGSVFASSRYLLAVCCLELGLYGEAEDALFAGAVMGGNVNKAGLRNRAKEDEDWFLSEPCPIPNGAAGLHLLGVICRKSNRKRQAAEYFRLSLKLDPLMWTSFEYLCEMGFPEKDIDPIATFGVSPSSFLPPSAAAAMTSSSPLPPDDDDDIDVTRNTHTILSPHHNLTPFAIATSNNNAIGAGAAATTSTPTFSTPLKQQQQQLPPSTRIKQALFDTPNLTPIQRPMPSRINNNNNNNNINNPRHSSMGGGNTTSALMSAMGAPHTAASSVTSSAHQSSSLVLTRARKVASRLYYEPSPESCWGGGYDAITNNYSRMNTSLHLSFSSQNASATPSSTPIDQQSSNRALFRGSHSTKRDDVMQMAPLTPLGESATELSTQQPDESRNNNNDANTAPAPVPAQQQQQMQSNNLPSMIASDITALTQILTLLCTLGTAYKSLCHYHLTESLSLFATLPPSQFHTGWVLHQVGRAHFELADYPRAMRTLTQMHQLEPHRLKGLEVLSTTLWHLKKEVDLCALAQAAVDFDKLTPEAWCVVGNCFSLQKEHEVAIQFFRRSVQLDPNFTYSHTLSGHEYVSNEDFDRAASCYRDAIRSDERHYNAWYGLGAIYFRQEKYDLAEYHFRRALEINPRSSVLYCHLGMAQHANAKPYEALQTLEKAMVLDERNAQARYQRASIYISLDRPREALRELEKVRDAAPREASVHFSMGKVYKRLGEGEKAMRCFLTALDLDPKDNNMIKASMDRLEEPDVEEDVSAF
eukprot:CAMPEP_0172517882 /NCGR_PEP_ID=MMETSP1066-20121228/288648_1 /TAXON_ID=671091 /ORGANISM="Coscinodiscus wailesii, Strain CCMP2513" /LENGTH=766 /DNA_ID=CAMNT_0013300085 /DNA_START=88 /DNA_END=2388 /DNA_ORIENTATION=+